MKTRAFLLTLTIVYLSACGSVPAQTDKFTPTITPLQISPLPTKTVTNPQTLIPSETQTASPAVTPLTAIGKILSGAGETKVYVRSGPGTTYGRIGSLQAGVEVQVTGKDPHGDWWRVIADGMEGWVFSSFVIVEGNTQAVPCVAGSAGDCNTANAPIENDQGIASIRAMFDPQDLSLSFLEETNNPNADLRKSLVYTDEEGGEYWVDQQTLQVVQWIAGKAAILSEVKTLDLLRTLAKTFAMRQSPTFRQKSNLLSITEITKDGKQYAFRWEDRTLPGHVLFPFMQVVVRTDGQILNYINTLDIFEK